MVLSVSSMMMTGRGLLLAAVLLSQACVVLGWNQDHMALYDLVEEVNQNFYEVIGVPEDATTSQIRKAFRTLSMTEHPDKTNVAGAEEKFRKIVAMVEILKDSDLRQEYDRVLVEGLPSWNSGAFYYRAAVKISVTQTFILVGVGSSLMHFAFMWTTYFETLNSWQTAMDKRSKRAKAETGDAKLNPKDYDIYPPSFWNIYSIKFVITLPSNIYWLLITLPKEKRLATEEAAAIALAEAKEDEEEAIRIEELKNRPAYVKPTPKFQEIDESITAYVKTEVKQLSPTIKIKYKSGPWSDDEISKLVKCMARFPGGSINRWERVSVEMQRTEKECMKQANGIKSGLTRVKNPNTTAKNIVKQRRDPSAQTISATPTISTTSPTLATTTAAASAESDNTFSQSQQNQLQDALRTVAKDATDRWDQISACVAGKTKKQCIARVRLLAKGMAKSS